MSKLVRGVALGAVCLGLLLLLPTASFAADSGPELYKQKCAMCHGANGDGKGKLPDLGSADVQKKSDGELKDAVLKGTKTAKGMMPKYGDKLSSDQIDVLIKFIRSLKK